MAGVLATVIGWLGGVLVARLGAGVSSEAYVDAPASFETGIRLPRRGETRRRA
jgi:hypothetical protein